MRCIPIIFVVAVIAGSPINAFAQFTAPGFMFEWGASGSNNGEFNAPIGIAVGASGNVYVADLHNHRVQKFTSGGVFISAWGSFGTANGQFKGPRWVDVDSDENVYVVDTENNRIQKFDSSGNFLTAWGGNPAFNNPNGIAVHGNNVYVSVQFANQVQRFDLNGNHIQNWGTVSRPHDVFTDNAGNVYVAGFQSNVVQKFDANGTFILQWGSAGSGDGQFSEVTGGTVDAADNVYVCDRLNHRIQVFDTSGNFLGKWGSAGSDPGQFLLTDGIAEGPNGNIYVTDINNHRVQVFGDPGPFEIEIDVKPGSDKNPVNLKSRRVLPVALISTIDFDPSTVDPTTVTIADVVGVPVFAVDFTDEDVAGDEFIDLLLFFSVEEMVDKGAIRPDSEGLILMGETWNGDAFSGTDFTTIVPKK